MATRKKWYIGGGIAVGVIAVLAVLYSKHIYFRNPIVFLPQPQQFVSTDKGQQFFWPNNDASFANIKEVSGGTATDALSYESAYRLYQGRIVQLDQNCRAQPLTLLIPPKSVIMIGNDSQWQRSINVGRRTSIVAPYDYILTSFNDAGTFPISCDSVDSAAIISVQ